MAKLPDGVEIDLHFWLVSDSLNAEGKVSLRGNVQFPVPEVINAAAMAKAAGLPVASDWRLMSRQEVAFAKADAAKGGAP